MRATDRRRAVRLLAILMWPLTVAAAAAQALPEPPEVLRVVAYNTANYLVEGDEAKGEDARRAVVAVLVALRPDIVALLEVGGEGAAAEIAGRLEREGLAYPYRSVVAGADEIRRIAVLARHPPLAVHHETAATYRLDARDVPLRRGFGVWLFAWNNGYRLRLVAAHLKSKVFHPLGQTDMRRYEARQLRYLIDDLIATTPDENLLVVGDFNDTPDSSPLSTLIARQRNPRGQLYDLRPTDPHGLAWTHCFEAQDTYSRIDYALASYALVPELVLEQTALPVLPAQAVASDHRPLCIAIRPRDRTPGDADFKVFERNVRRRPPAGPDAAAEDGQAP